MSTVEEQLGKRIARQRKAVGLTQAQLAETVGVQPETISRVETGSKTASLDLLIEVAAALELELHELFRIHDRNDAKDEMIDRLLRFALRLSMAEVELVLDVGSSVVAHMRRVQRLREFGEE